MNLKCFQHPRLQKLNSTPCVTKDYPVVGQIINLLKTLLSQTNISKQDYENLFKYQVDFQLHLNRQEQTLLRFYFYQLYVRTNSTPYFKKECKDSFFYTILLTYHQKITLNQLYYVVQQMFSDSNDFQKLMNFCNHHKELKKKYNCTFNLKFLPNLVQAFKNANEEKETEYLCVGTLVELIEYQDEQSKINKKIILKELEWVHIIFNAILEEIYTAVFTYPRINGNKNQRYNMWRVFHENLILEQYTPSQLWKFLINKTKLWDIGHLIKHLRLPISRDNIYNLQLFQIEIQNFYQIGMFADFICYFAEYNKFFQSFEFRRWEQMKINQNQNYEFDEQASERIKNRQLILSYVQKIIQQKIDPSSPDHNYFWLPIILKLLQQGYQTQDVQNFHLFCHELMDTSLPRYLYNILLMKQINQQNLQTIQLVIFILQFFWSAFPKNMCVQAHQNFSLDVAKNKEKYTKLSPRLAQYQTHALVLYRKYKQCQFCDWDEQLIEAIESVIEKGVLESPSALFLQNAIKIQNITGSQIISEISLLISIAMVSDINHIFEDFIKYQFRNQILSQPTAVLKISVFDSWLGKKFRYWIEYHDNHPKNDIQFVFKMDYQELRYVVQNLENIFTCNQE